MLNFGSTSGRSSSEANRSGAGLRIYGAMLGVVVVLVTFQVLLTTFIPPLQYFDEMLLPAALIVIAGHMLAMRVPRIDLLIVLLLIYLFLVSVFLGRSTSVTGQIIQVLIHLKFFLLYVLFRPLLVAQGELDRLEKVYVGVGALSLFGLALSFFMPEMIRSFNQVAGMTRFGLVRATGFQVKPNDVALFLSPLLIMLVAQAAVARENMRLIVLFVLAAFIFLANTSRVAALTIPFSALLMLLIGRLPKSANVIMVLTLLTALPLLVLSPFMRDIVDYTMHDLSQITRVDQTEYIRVIMIYYSFVIAADYFPFGSGAGTYGSMMSEGSPVYGDLGLYGLSYVDRFMGVFDSNMATVLGEFGAIGVVLFVWLTVLVLRDIRQALNCPGRPAVLYHRVMLAFLLLVALTNPLYMYSLTSISILLAAIIGPRYLSTAAARETRR